MWPCVWHMVPYPWYTITITKAGGRRHKPGTAEPLPDHRRGLHQITPAVRLLRTVLLRDGPQKQKEVTAHATMTSLPSVSDVVAALAVLDPRALHSIFAHQASSEAYLKEFVHLAEAASWSVCFSPADHFHPEAREEDTRQGIKAHVNIELAARSPCFIGPISSASSLMILGRRRALRQGRLHEEESYSWFYRGLIGVGCSVREGMNPSGTSRFWALWGWRSVASSFIWRTKWPSDVIPWSEAAPIIRLFLES